MMFHNGEWCRQTLFFEIKSNKIDHLRSSIKQKRPTSYFTMCDGSIYFRLSPVLKKTSLVPSICGARRTSSREVMILNYSIYALHRCSYNCSLKKLDLLKGPVHDQKIVLNACNVLTEYKRDFNFMKQSHGNVWDEEKREMFIPIVPDSFF